jgi:hypothetical protein
MRPRDNEAEVAAAEHVVNVVGGEFRINDTGAEPRQYDVDVTTADGTSVALEATSFGGDDWRRTAARVKAARDRGNFVGEGLQHQWWVIFPSGADLWEMDEPLTELLRRLEREGIEGVTRRYDGDDATQREVAQVLGALNISTVWVWDAEPDADAPRILPSQSDTWVGGLGDLSAALTALFEKRDNQQKLARAKADERHLYVVMEDGGANGVLEGVWPLPACPPDPEGVIDTLWVYSASVSSLVFRVRPGTEQWEKFVSVTGEPA